MELLDRVREQARSNPKRIVLPEAGEERTLRAADRIIGEGIAKIILLGNPEKIHELAEDWGLENVSRATIIDPLDNKDKSRYVDIMLDIRGEKGLTRDEAERLIEDPLHLSVLMIKAGDADGEVCGANSATGDVLRPAFQYVRTKPGVSVVSGAFIMILKDKLYGENGMLVFADCAVNADPDAAQLAQIAVSTAETARNIARIDPRIAMLSFSTKGSAHNPRVDKMVEATRIARELAPGLKIDGELQSDAAIVPGIGSIKAPGSPIAGRANVLIFPSLEAGNIAYKLVQRIGEAEAIGPILQGMAAPINDLSRGCKVSDIVNLVAITVCQAQSK